ncbi:doublecortin domain-containing protein 5 [Cricetulus griseus]|nr:doublecortin domain-containing protein 5 [Cricetulus griseus]
MCNKKPLVDKLSTRSCLTSLFQLVEVNGKTWYIPRGDRLVQIVEWIDPYLASELTVRTQPLPNLLEACTHKLNLNMAARRVFLADGSEAFKPEDIPHEANVYISTGEPFLDPFKKLKVTKEFYVNLTKVRVIGEQGASIEKMIWLLTSLNVLGMIKVLDVCTMKMNLDSPARYIYDMSGRKVEDISKVPVLEKCLQDSITPLRGPLWVSKGEGFSPSGAKMYIQGVLGALYPRLKSAKNYYKQKGYGLWYG